MFGFMLGSFLTKIYVDIGSVDLGREQLKQQQQPQQCCSLYVYSDFGTQSVAQCEKSGKFQYWSWTVNIFVF